MIDAPRVWAATRLGLVRSTNEDRCRVGGWRSDGKDVDWSGTLSWARPWALVADGMGGHGAGDIASSVAVDAFDRLLFTRGLTDLPAVIEDANRAVFQAMAEPAGRRGMGTTVAGLAADGRQLILFNVGDSRIYRLRRDKLQMLSVDDTPSRTGHGGARSHALTQSLGGTSVPLPIRPHIIRDEPLAGDIVLLCTDGLTDMLSDDELCKVMSEHRDHPAAALASQAVSAGGRDNVTVAVVLF